ncbi:MAG: anion permease [Alphaproteobacteria bacterium]
MTIGLGLWYLPVPAGLDVKTWHLFAIFMATVVALIAKPLPMGPIALLAIVVSLSTKTLTIQQALSSYSSKIPWLILVAIMIARGFVKTGLGSRIAYYFIALLGRSTLGLSYGIVSTEMLLAPFVPSNTARGAGIIYPVLSSLALQFGSDPEAGSERKLGAFLIKVAYQANLIASAMFMTAMAANPLIASLAGGMGINIDWTTWALAAIVPGLVNMIVLPPLMMVFYPPEIRHTPEAPEMARKKLSEMGSLSFDELVMVFTFGLLLTLWVVGATFGIDATTTAFLGLGILLFSGVLNWNDVLNEHNAWNTFFWLATLLMLAGHLSEFGLMTWFSGHVQGYVASFHWVTTLAIVALIYYYSHYFFASMTAHVTAMFSALLVVTIATGAPPMLAALLMAFLSNLCASITHYGTGTAPVYFASNYVKVGEWWRVGFIFSLVSIAIWAGIGSIWWSFIGLW